MKNLLNKIRNSVKLSIDSFLESQLKHFTIEELIESETVEENNIDNIPTEEQRELIRMFIIVILDPLRDAFGKEIIVNSGFRSKALNKALKGAKNSHHLYENGYSAADITAVNKRDNKRIFELVQEMKLPFCQLIWEKGNDEYPQWVHISYNNNDIRKQILYSK